MDEKLEKMLNDKDCYFIHYSSDGFYNGTSPAPRISCISLFRDGLETKISFSIDRFFGGHSVEYSEKFLLKEFASFIKARPNISFIHWNMDSKGFGFKAIWARAKELGIELSEIKEENLFDLASYIAYISERRLSIKQILWFNSLLDKEYLDGKDEASYFEKKKFCEITASVNLKVVGLYFVVQELKEGTLHVDKPFAEPNDGLTKEERRQQAHKIAEAREQMLKDMVNHNKKLLNGAQQAYEEYIENYEPAVEEEHSLFFFDFGHPFISLFANWFANR